MRISDWSSDVCASDLCRWTSEVGVALEGGGNRPPHRRQRIEQRGGGGIPPPGTIEADLDDGAAEGDMQRDFLLPPRPADRPIAKFFVGGPDDIASDRRRRGAAGEQIGRAAWLARVCSYC